MSPRIAIVGGGPAGAAAAVRLAQLGMTDVLLLEKARLPRDKTCGGGLSPNALQLAGELGIGAAVLRSAYPVNALRLVTPGGRQMHLATRATTAFVMPRRDFDQLLVQEARRLGVQVREGFRVTSLLTEGDHARAGGEPARRGYRVRRRAPGQGRVLGVCGHAEPAPAPLEEIPADVVICADGAHASFTSDPRPRTTLATLMGWWEDVPFEPHTMEMFFDHELAPHYGWLFPEGPGRANVGICLPAAVGGAAPRADLRAIFDRFLERHLAHRLRPARQVGKLRGHPIAYTRWIGHVTAPGVLVTGDAARLAHNATGEGIYQAMRSGWLAARAATDALAGLPEELAFRRYTRALRRELGPALVVGSLFQTAIRTPILDAAAALFDNRTVRAAVTRVVGTSLAGSDVGHPRR